jgi:glycosyltransferase involved in cell wall biosynthesis
MRVITLTWEYPPYISGGLGMACYGLVKSLLRRGVEQVMILPAGYHHMTRPQDADRFLSAHQVPKHENSVRKGAGSEVGRWEQPPGSAGYRNDYGTGSCFYTGEIFREIYAYADRARWTANFFYYDAIHAHEWHTYPAALGLKYVSEKPCVLHVHSTEFDRATGVGNHRIHRIEYESLHRADRVVTVSHYTKQIIQTQYGIDSEKISVIHNAYVMEKKALPGRRLFRGPVVLFLGRLTRQKGPEYFLQLAKRVIALYPQVHFIMAGTGDMEKGLIHQSGLYRLKTRLLFTGFLRREEVYRILCSSDILVFPSVSEPFGMSPLEAMRLGVPAIVSKKTGSTEILRNIIKVDYWDIDAMTRAIVDLLSNPAKRRGLARAARNEVKHITWDRAADLLKALYEDIVC